ncbi:MAG TPA: ribulokinase [Candidatus Gallacutalibacter stercoravium]|nr:ribulokinase [Candidatus Gallacutalibacter stercoravium]
MGRYAIGLDYGTLSGRAVLIDVATGEELASSVYEYPHGVMDEALPNGAKLPPDWALQHPSDYIGVLANTIPAVLKESGVNPCDVIGVGADFTACTVLPVKADGTPLCFLPEFEGEPNAYVKLWKHHAAQDKATRLNEIAASRGEKWLGNYGGKISSEWAIPKLWQVLDEAPQVYAAADRWIEAADWIIWQLTGVETRNSCTAGYKAIWNKNAGYPDDAFFKALDPRMEHVVDEKLSRTILPLGSRAGVITEAAASLTGLCPGTPVAVGNVDAHVCVPAVGIDGPGKMLAIMGTSTCHIMVDEKELQVPGMCGVVADGVLPGYYGYEAGQSCVGDHFAWFIDNCLPASYYEQAKAQGINIHQFLRQKAQVQRPGESGLLALDWWNGNRSVLVDADLSGVMLGMTLQTKPEEIYRALIEATAYGTRMIIENYREHGLAVEEFYASGGISQKDPMTMQIYADVINMPVRIAGSAQGPAYGSAMFGAVAAGKAAGGFDTIFDAARALGRVKDTVYTPNPENAAIYDKLFAEYRTLHDYFGRGENNVLKRLKALKAQSKGNA